MFETFSIVLFVVALAFVGVLVWAINQWVRNSKNTVGVEIISPIGLIALPWAILLLCGTAKICWDHSSLSAFSLPLDWIGWWGWFILVIGMILEIIILILIGIGISEEEDNHYDDRNWWPVVILVVVTVVVVALSGWVSHGLGGWSFVFKVATLIGAYNIILAICVVGGFLLAGAKERKKRDLAES